MKTIKNIFLLIVITLISTIKMSAQNTEQDAKLGNELDSFSYAIGYSVASNLVKSGVDTLAYDELVEGFKAFLNREEPKIEESKINDIIQSYLGSLAQKQHGGNMKEGEDFLAANAKKDGVLTTASGLQYKIITAGTGATPVDGDNVTTHYTGKLIDGTIFDSSVQRGEPTSFGVNQVIAGWTEALKLMPAGSKWELYIPHTLAYGDRDMGNIKPFSCLIFELELISITPK
jgi:FKBP-type peptidyl-prolyl cis-trans isomerase FklB